MDLISKIFETKRNIQMLHLCSRLHLPPTSETSTLLAIYGLTAQQTSPGVSVSDLAVFLNVSVPTVSRCLQKLTSKGYVQKTLNERDKRTSYVTLTSEGKQLCRNANDTIAAFLSRVLTRLDASEMEQFVSTMDKIYEAVRSELSEEDN